MMFKKTERKEKKAMPKTRKGSAIELYNSHFAATLRALMEKNGTTQKEIATAVGIRPQTLSLYCTGETQPNVDKLLKIAEFFHVTTDYLITGTVLEDIPAREMFGLSGQHRTKGPQHTSRNRRISMNGRQNRTFKPICLNSCHRTLTS